VALFWDFETELQEGILLVGESAGGSDEEGDSCFFLYELRCYDFILWDLCCVVMMGMEMWMRG
jgi:hypothetical protein